MNTDEAKTFLRDIAKIGNVVGTDIDGEDLTFCTVFSKEENFVLCVTVF